MNPLTPDQRSLIREAITRKELIRAWLDARSQRQADRLAALGILTKGGVDTGSCVTRNQSYRYDLSQVPYTRYHCLVEAGILTVHPVFNGDTFRLYRHDRVVASDLAGKVIAVTAETVLIEATTDDKELRREYTIESLKSLNLQWVEVCDAS